MTKIFTPSQETLNNTSISRAQYEAMYAGSINQPDIFWAVQSKRIDWIQKPSIIKNASFEGDVSIKWYEDGTLNACYNCVDRHVEAGHGTETAFIFEHDEPGKAVHISYAEVLKHVSKLANGLKSLGVEKGDRVIIYMPMIPHAAFAMLACARIGAIHSVVFGGFSPESLADRIHDCEAKVVITADEAMRGGRSVPLKANTDEGLDRHPELTLQNVIVLSNTGADVNMKEGRDLDWDALVESQSEDCPCEVMNAEDPLFILYTSGSTGKPKGVLHTTGGYMVYASFTHEAVFDYKPGDVFWCTADVGWITGHSYVVYGPMANRATQIIFEGIPTYPDVSRFWQIVEDHKVNQFYTAPTAIRALLKSGDEHVQKHDLSSLRTLGTVGEPINHEAWLWYYNVVGGGRCPILDTWWQTETGGHMMTPLSSFDLKPSSAMQPFFGVKPVLLDHDKNIIEGAGEGALCIEDSWPGQMRSIYGDHDRFIETYFSKYPGRYFTGDGARRDEDGDYWITGRLDDVLNVSGHRLGTAEIESAINEHADVAESAVVGFPHDIKGQGVYAFVILKEGGEPSDDLKKEINKKLRHIIGPIAKCDKIQFTPALPKTRSGKIMRRILRKIAQGKAGELGDISTLAEPEVVSDLIAHSQ